MQIVAVQFDMLWQEKKTNHEKVRQLLANVEIEEGSLIILPEMFDTGFSMQLEATAQAATRESEAFLQQLALERQAAVLAGVVGPRVKVSDGAGYRVQASNEAVAFSPEGAELVRYRKMQPFTPSGEDTKYGCGQGHKVFEWAGIKIAPFLCYDLRFPEVFRPAALDGAELIVVMACWPDVRSEHWVRLLQARAIENQAITVGVNRCGADPTLTYDGRSAAFTAMGEPIFEADATEQVLKADIAIDEVRQWRAQFPALQDVRTEFRFHS